MKKIYKYSIGEAVQEIALPADAVFLSAAFQPGNNHTYGHREDLKFWAMFDTEDEHALVPYKLFVIPTGVEFEIGDATYLNTVHTEDRKLVFHIFYRKM